MPRRASAPTEAEREEVYARLKDAAIAAATEIHASAAQGLAYLTEMEEIDEEIVRLRARRAEVYRLRKAHADGYARLRRQQHAKIGDLLDDNGVLTAQRLTIVTELLYGGGNPATVQVLREGRQLLRTIDGDPLVCHGFARMATHGLWFGARTSGTPRIALVSGIFCIIIPVVCSGGQKDVCNVPIASLSTDRQPGGTVYPQVYVSTAGIDAGVLHVAPEMRRANELGNVRSALLDAGYTPQQCDALFARIPSSD